MRRIRLLLPIGAFFRYADREDRLHSLFLHDPRFRTWQAAGILLEVIAALREDLHEPRRYVN